MRSSAYADTKAAVADYDSRDSPQPEFVDAYSNRAVAKRAMGRHEDAIADFDQVIHLRPTMPKPTVGGAMRRLPLSNTTTPSLITIRQFVSSQTCRSLRWAGNREASLGPIRVMRIADYDQAIRLRPDYATVAYSDRGNAKHLLGR